MAETQDALSTDEDVDEILKLALRKQGRDDYGLRARLESAAQELGISAQELTEAEEEYSFAK